MNINDKIADIERQLAELKAEAAKPVVEYRDAEWPRDAGREAQFGSGFTINSRIVGYDANEKYCWKFTWGAAAKCRVSVYRTPSLPADAGKVCEFSDDGEKWEVGKLSAWFGDQKAWYCERIGYFPHCRIKD